MQLLLMAMVLGLFIHDVAAETLAWRVEGWSVLLAILLPKLLWMSAYWLACRRTYRKLQGAGAGRALRRMDRLSGVFRLGVLLLFASDLLLGGLMAIRQIVGNAVLLDELVILLPSLAALMFGWWAYYPIDRRLRESALIRELDSGRAFKPVWSRWGYVVTHLRHEAALILVPLLMILSWYEAVPLLFPQVGEGWQVGLRLAGAGAVFLLAPLVIRYVWDTQPLPPGEVRDAMMRLCEQHRVKVRDVLLWRTSGQMINAAVMGLVGPLRYIMLSDGLLDQLHRPQVEAVMAHELAHVKRRHMFWLIAAALAALGGAELVIATALFSAADTAGLEMSARSTVETISLGSTVAAVIVWAGVFGWVSRRVERQADAFAVQHLVARSDPGRSATIDAESVQIMVSALQQVADLNHVAIGKHNWRHGSIAFRQDYLRSLIGQRVDDVSVDRHMNRIKLATIGVIGLVAAAHLLFDFAMPL